MKAFKCAVIGNGDVFGYAIESNQRVTDLKIAIKKYMGFKCDLHEFTLFLAQSSDGNWLKATDPDVPMLKAGKIPRRIKQLMTQDNKMEEGALLSTFNLPEGKLNVGDIHMLVAGAHRVKILCAIVGIDDIVPMKIDERDCVVHLKQAIMKCMEFRFHWSELKLYVAKVNGAYWLRSDNPGVAKLKAGMISSEIKRMMTDVAEMKGEYELSEFHFTDDDEGPSGRQIHVIVDLPAHAKAYYARNARNARYART
ncbi:hypothetical protein DYB25_012625 [Aphanomyces astaci]|uniref:Crinkler effector protein N-terminal domain-containing protein n=1 Tax=Aphanomyces astaci TaxID=112090 RepID=A0A397AJC2_APHAT|nr:hypothetical protein DYB36_006408 [Aphanomyces astaci]RHY37459.1 hypothetical protein DYB25_012625 [Aphanomyces astaci]RHY57306.1 hypothetical protein DYB38_013068 [Aphanomyces astaci]RHY68805.1 hypothetical protein DYB34_012912 [Aphanomyces astaci]